LVIDGSRQQRNLNLNAELTDAKVKQFAEATAAKPVRYAWQGDYKQENPNPTARATRGESASFTAVVNPWPSENIECNPITVSWENFEKHVIVAGAETKVGKINIPAVTGQGTDDSMSRMVVEAYDGNGQFIGTTDPAASGGTKNLRIDETTGDIYFTWPEYRGTDLATDKNVNFSVLAKPRSVDELKAAGENNNEFGTPHVFDSSNSLTRYNKANVIDSKAFSLDDTEYHSPKYDKTDATIISGVDSATGPIATEPQKVTFTQTPDLIKDLAKKKGDGGFEAKVTLDEKYVYEGWTVEMDEDYNVTVTAPENPRPGTFARPVITVEYSNGSTDKLELLVVVDPNNTQVTDLVRPSLTKGHIGDDLTAQVGTKSIMKGYKPVHPAKFEIDESTVPEGWTVTVDETGKVTAKADDTVAPGTIITPKVKATYPDQTTDEIETQFQAIVDIKIPTYDTVTNKPTAKVSLKPELPERGLSGNTTDEAPKRYTFPDGKTQMTVTDDSGTWTVKIDENTGEITTTIPRTAPEGYILNVPVLAYYDNADKPQEVKGTVVVLKSDVAPVYDVQSTGPNQAVEHHVQDAPKGSKFSFGKDENDQPITEQEVDGWKYKVDPNTGVVTSTPPADAKPGDKKTVTVTVEAPDGSTPVVPVTTVVKLSNNWEAEPFYPVQTVYPGESATLPVELNKPDNINVAKENPYKLGDLPAGWKATIDDNGQVTATAPADAKPGDQVKIPVTVTYEDGSTDTAYAVVNVIDVPTREVPFKVEYKYDDTIPAGEYKVETKGEPGSEKQNKDGTWERTKEPKNEVVVIGTKPAESAKEVTWKVPIPYPTEVRENPDLKPGETRVVQEGENGEKTYTAKFTAKGSEAQVAEEEITKEPVTRIIEVGPGIPDQELTTKKTQEVPFEIEYVYDDTLESGTQVVDQEGVPGEQTITSTQKIKDGKPDGEPTINIEQTKAPQKAKIRIGTKTTGETSETVKSEVPFGVKIEFDPNMPAGKSEVVTEGVPGEKTVTITREIVNSKPGDPQITEEITKQPVDQVIKVGTKPSEASSKVTWTAQVPFEVITRPNPELKPGEIKVVQKGVPGEKTYTADFTAKGDQATVSPEEKQTKDPVDEIIEYGPAAEDTEVVTKVEKPVPFETEIVFDNTLKKGEQVVDQEGELGTEVVTSIQKIVDGKPSGDPEVTTERTKQPTKRIIRV
ncbi:MAG: G5 domain-containing protein, partial [Dermabacter sp.]|nr:G5 domain-containing protein [Dermabacter sp.]